MNTSELRDCPFCGASARVPKKAISFWLNMLVRAGIKDFSERSVNSIRKPSNAAREKLSLEGEQWK